MLDKKAKSWGFKPGDKVLLYLPIKGDSLQNRYFSPYVVHKRVNNTGYVINAPDRDRKSRYSHKKLLKGSIDKLPIVLVFPVQIERHSLPCDDAPLPAKTLSISQYSTPTNRREVCRFLVMAGYYCCFCANFATVVAPITSLLKKELKFQWSDECKKSFNLLKQMLSSSPMMVAPDYQMPFMLAVDASDVGAGAVLFQEDKSGLDHPVSFFSKRFDKTR